MSDIESESERQVVSDGEEVAESGRLATSRRIHSK